METQRRIFHSPFRVRDWLVVGALALGAGTGMAQVVVSKLEPVDTKQSAAAGVFPRPADPEPVVATGVQGGLCVVLPASDGAALARLSCDGRFVVQGLIGAEGLDAARAGIPAQLGGLLSVVTWKPSLRLDYADNLVDLIIVDRDALKGAGPADAELLRMISPVLGAAYVRKAGVWAKIAIAIHNNWEATEE